LLRTGEVLFNSTAVHVRAIDDNIG